MFRSLRRGPLNPDQVFAVTVGDSDKDTLAKWHLEEPEDVIAAITMLNSTDDLSPVSTAD